MAMQTHAPIGNQRFGASEVASFSVDGAFMDLHPYMDAYDRFIVREKSASALGRTWSIERVGTKTRFVVVLPLTAFAVFLSEVAKVHRDGRKPN